MTTAITGAGAFEVFDFAEAMVERAVVAATEARDRSLRVNTGSGPTSTCPA